MGKFMICFVVLVTIAIALSACFHFKHDKAKQNDKISPAIIYNATVSKDKIGAYKTITDALASAPTYSNTKYYIHVEAGLYVERVGVWENLTNIVLIGDGAFTTKIQWKGHSVGFRTSETATLAVIGDGFIAMFLTFENAAGDGSRAVAVMTLSNHAAYYRCIFLGYQDTLYAKRGVQFYKNCDIYGTVDFIFGGAAAVFQSCKLFARLPRTITFTAQQKDEDQDQSGFVIQGCTLTVAPGLEQQKPTFQAFLGRPWSNYSTVVVMESYLDNIIEPAGWLDWENRSTTDKLTYLEFRNSGPGAATAKRVDWIGFEDVSGQPHKVRSFTVGEFIDRDNWLRGTGIPYSSGFIYK